MARELDCEDDAALVFFFGFCLVVVAVGAPDAVRSLLTARGGSEGPAAAGPDADRDLRFFCGLGDADKEEDCRDDTGEEERGRDWVDVALLLRGGAGLRASRVVTTTEAVVDATDCCIFDGEKKPTSVDDDEEIILQQKP